MIRIDPKEIEKANKILEGIEGGIEKVTTRALNRALSTAKTRLKKKATQEYYIKQKDIEKTLKTDSAHSDGAGNITGTIYSTGGRLSITKFKIKKRETEINAAIKKVSGFKTITGKRELFGKPFTAKMKSGHTGVYQRKLSKRPLNRNKGDNYTPIKELKTLSIPQMLGSKTVNEYIEEDVKEIFTERLEHEIERLIGGIKK